ncbi:MAG: ROK family protein [Propionibacteriaceae bacterium]
MTTTVLALDIGGTKIAGAVVTDSGEILAQAYAPTQSVVAGNPRCGDEVFSAVEFVVDELLTCPALPAHCAVGIGSAGPIELAEGTISPVNIPGWRQFPIVERVSAAVAARTGHHPQKVTLLGDGHAVALGEWWRGAAQGSTSAIGCITSTGVGAGVVIDGVAYQGRSGNAVHMGHQVVEVTQPELCACGSYGCVEAYASGTAMVRRAKQRGWSGQSMPELAQAARDKDPLALAIIDEGMTALAAGLAGLATTFDIPLVVVGGGVSKAGDVIFDPLKRHFARFTKLNYITDAEIRPAQLDNAGLLGAAKAALDC